MTNGGATNRLRTQMAALKPQAAQYTGDQAGGRRPVAAADVQGGIERAEPGEVLGDRGEHVVGRAEGGVIELGGEQVVTPLGGGERLLGEFPERRPLGVEHEVSVTCPSRARSAA